MGCLKLKYYQQESTLRLTPEKNLWVLERNETPLKKRLSTYTYGFNGKEKDQNGEFGLTTYDYGFRIYNPGIAKFLSVDPLAPGYPYYTPYQFGGNRPIDGIDLDGLESLSSKEKNGEGIYHLGTVVSQLGEHFQFRGNGKWIRIFSGSARNGVQYSVKNLWKDLPKDYNRGNGYTYTKNELEIRRKIFATNNPITRYIKSVEKEGNPVPLSVPQAEIKYGGTANARFLAWTIYMGAATDLAAGTFTLKPLPTKGPKNFNFTVARKVRLDKGVNEVLGNGYEAVALKSNTIKNQAVLNTLNKAERGDWSKIYEVGYLNGQKV